MDTTHPSMEEKIIAATIDCIEKYGFSGATNRRIAQAAEVNLAAINYYFRSKENLILRVMEITLRNAFDLSTMEPIQGETAQERCLNVMLHIAQGGLNYPGLTRAHFYNLLAEGKHDALLSEHADRFIDDLAIDLLNHGCALAPAELKVALIQIFSALLTGILAPTLFAQPRGFRLDELEAFRAYLTRLVERLLG